MQTKPIYLFAKWQVKEGNLTAILGLLDELVQKSREEEGNITYNIHQSIADKNILMLYEVYAGEPAVDAHRNSAHFQEIVIQQIIPLLESREAILATAIF